MDVSEKERERFVENQWIKVRGKNEGVEKKKYVGFEPFGRRHYQVLENFRSLERRSFSLFVDNLPNTANREWLWELFSREGEVVDVFLSKKVRKHSPFHFAFVRFAYKNHAIRATNKINGWEFEGVQLLVTEAKYGRNKRYIELPQPQSNCRHQVSYNQVEAKVNREIIRDKRSFKNVLMGDANEKGDMGEINDQSKQEVVKGEVDVGLVEMLKRSLIELPDERKYLCKSEDGAMFVNNGGDSKICSSNKMEVVPSDDAGTCEESFSTRCIVDDRKSEDLINETQLAPRDRQNMKECPIQHNSEVQELEVESNSNPHFPPGSEDYITEQDELNQ
ncbi:hypothetical protein PIB30_001090 [Stylosanthes scabra]|uniref:RRM domain-containing protein n=1 Tax=Stylosanthes scabra TaxID=79078 RepID=A0ABU6U2F5_9FABA|nr:hypothetical protein [Stylosanthes scabra]